MGAPGDRTPMVHRLPVCSARPASGRIAAAPRTMTNARRFNDRPAAIAAVQDFSGMSGPTRQAAASRPRPRLPGELRQPGTPDVPHLFCHNRLLRLLLFCQRAQRFRLLGCPHLILSLRAQRRNLDARIASHLDSIRGSHRDRFVSRGHPASPRKTASRHCVGAERLCNRDRPSHDGHEIASLRSQ